MMENLIVALIVAASAWYAGRKYLPVLRRKADDGCASGCGACKSGCDTPAEPAQASGRRVIPIRSL